MTFGRGSPASDWPAGCSFQAVSTRSAPLVVNPYNRVFTGIEYLYGHREDVSGATGSANRLQASFGFCLP